MLSLLSAAVALLLVKDFVYGVNELIDCEDANHRKDVYVNRRAVYECVGNEEAITQCVIEMDSSTKSYEYITPEFLSQIPAECKRGTTLLEKCNSLLTCTINEVKNAVGLSNIHFDSFKEIFQRKPNGELTYKEGEQPAKSYWKSDFDYPLCTESNHIYFHGIAWLQCPSPNSYVEFQNCVLSSDGSQVEYIDSRGMDESQSITGLAGSLTEQCRSLTDDDISRIRQSNIQITSVTFTDMIRARASGAMLLRLSSNAWIE